MSEPRRWTINVCRKHGPVPVYWQSDQRGPRCSHYLRTKRPCGLPAPRVDVMEAAPVEAELERLRSNTDFWEQRYRTQHGTVHAMEDEIARLRKIEVAARDVLDAWNQFTNPKVRVGPVWPRMVALREALGEPSDA